MIDGGWEFWIDRGGTFTDVVARTPAGELKTLKLLSVDPERYEDAAVAGIERLLAAAPHDERRVAAVKMGTTVATNALLERRGEPTVLVITAGLDDALRIGGQQRPDIFALDIALPEMLYVRAIGAIERIDAQGRVVTPLDLGTLRRDLEAAHGAGLRSAAIVLLHGYRFPQHELAAAELARSIGFSQVSVSHRVLPLPKLVARGHTTLADAYLSPVLDRYVASVRRGLERSHAAAPLYFMQSHGGLTAADRFRGKDSLLSGPAGGVIGMVRAASAVGCTEVIGFDMGGTSTDVALYAGELERTTDAVIAAVHVSAPMLKIQTVAAGGGSILSFGLGRLKVGPESAGADPGTRVLPPRRAADGDRRERAARQDRSRVFSTRVRAQRRRAARRERHACGVRRVGPRRRRRDRRRAERRAPRSRLRPHRRRAHGQRDQADLRAARPRRHALRVVLLRRRRRSARGPSRGGARHPHRHHPPLGRRAVRVWDRHRRRPRARASERRGTAR